MNLLKLRKTDKNFVVMAINSMGAILKDTTLISIGLFSHNEGYDNLELPDIKFIKSKS